MSTGDARPDGASFDADRLYGLLPAVYRIRDHAEGGPLRALLEVAADQAAVLEETLEQLYDDLFVETAAPWALPYLGDLLGVHGLPGAPLETRAEVANTLAWRRAKGTAHVLERIARDVTGFSARAVEFFELLAVTQHLGHVRPHNRAWVAVRGPTRGPDAGEEAPDACRRDGVALRLEDVGGPFERLEAAADLPHNADVRRPAGRRGRYNLPHVGVFLWRLRAYRLTASPAAPARDAPTQRLRERCFRFHPLGLDAPLVRLPATEEEPESLAEPANVSGRISRRAMAACPGDFYGRDRSLRVELPRPGGPELVPLQAVRVCDLSRWRLPEPGRVAIDPVLGRIAFGTRPKLPPRVTFHYAAAADVGGGEYARPAPSGDTGAVVRVDPAGGDDAVPDLAAALARVGNGGVVEFADSGRYACPPRLDVAGRRLTLRAADGARPLLLAEGGLAVHGAPGGALTLDGLLLAGGAVRVEALGAGSEGLGRLRIRHCTLVPGQALRPDGRALRPGEPSLVVRAAGTRVEVEASILGPVRAHPRARFALSGSVVDAGAEAAVAWAALDGDGFGPALEVRECTLVGRVKTEALPLASNSIFSARLPAGPTAAWAGPVVARRIQQGCVRFCYLPPGSRTPRRFACLPAHDEDDPWLRPAPLGTRYGEAAYLLLPADAPAALRRGADDESEPGVYHHLHLARREAHLRARLDEYLRFGLEAGVFYIDAAAHLTPEDRPTS